MYIFNLYFITKVNVIIDKYIQRVDEMIKVIKSTKDCSQNLMIRYLMRW